MYVDHVFRQVGGCRSTAKVSQDKELCSEGESGTKPSLLIKRGCDI